MGLNEDLDLLEKSIRQLQIEWEKFFGGVEKKPPTDLRARVEALIKKYAYAEIRNNGERFRYQTLSSRYATFNELWNKRMRAIEEGRTIVEPMKASSVFPAMVVSMIGVGEQAGALETMLTKIADFYELEVDAAVGDLTTALEPVMIVVLGVIVGGIVISMYLPIFSLVSQLSK